MRIQLLVEGRVVGDADPLVLFCMAALRGAAPASSVLPSGTRYEVRAFNAAGGVSEVGVVPGEVDDE